LNMSDVSERLPDSNQYLVLMGTAFVVLGLGVKMGLFPLHVWMPAAYSRSPLISASLMAPLVTKVAAFALLRILYWVYGWHYLADDTVVMEILCWAGAAAVISGALIALTQEDLRRMFAYSSISQMGIIALGIGLANTSALTGAMLHIINDAVMKCVLFMAAAMILFRFDISKVSSLWQLRGRAPWTSAAIGVTGFSLIGLPPFCGFFGKWYVLTGALEDERWVLAGAIIVGSLITAGYVFRLLEQLYFNKRSPSDAPAEGPGVMVLAIVALAAGIVLIGLGSEWIVTTLVQPGLPGEGG